MSQQSQFEGEERHYQSGYSSYSQDEESPQSNHLHEGFGQKVFHAQPVGRFLSAGQRLALAIVSVCVLIPLVAIILSNTSSDTGGIFVIGEQLIALAVVCLTIMVINIAANWRR
ncbi:MAG TPA: hypothetical protein VKV40_03760 [Ktedonobacteraceae bacterium]|nr:hypothetical protein [Ktedonobacteraceae bacterium]